jgi:hypothetical protein
MTLPDINTPDGRRAWAFIALVGDAMVSTAFLIVYTVMLRDKAGFVFWLAMCAELNAVISLTGLSALLVKRSYKVSRDSLEISDGDEP